MSARKRPSDLDKTRKLMEAVLGQQAKPVSQWEAVRAALAAGRSDLPVELPWGPEGAPQQILLQELRGDRVYYLNPGPRPARTASLRGRRAEPDGRESAPAAELAGLFAEGVAKALL